MTLFYYVFRNFFKYVFGIMALTTFMFVLFDFIHKSTSYLSKYQPAAEHLISYYLYKVPNLFVQGFPIASLLASVITMVLMSRTNEITAMRAIGMGPLRIGAPIAAGGILLCFVSLLLGEYVVPESARKMHFVEKVLIERKDDSSAIGGSRWIRSGRVLVNYQSYDRRLKRLSLVKVIYTGKSFRPKKTLEAKQAYFNEETGSWLLEKVKVHYFWPNGTLSYSERRENYTIQIPVVLEKIGRENRLPNEMSSEELRFIIRQGESSGSDVLGYRVDMEVKFAFYFASFIVSLIGLKFGYRSERSMETARSILLAIAIGVSYWFILNACRALGKAGTLPPMLSAWVANILIFLVSCSLIFRTRKS